MQFDIHQFINYQQIIDIFSLLLLFYVQYSNSNIVLSPLCTIIFTCRIILQLYNQQIYNGAKRLSGYSDQSCWCLVDNLLPVHSCTAQYSGLLGGTGQQGLQSRTIIIFQPAVRAQKFYSFIFLSTGLFRILALDYDITRKKCLFIAPRRCKTIYKKYLKYASDTRIFRDKTTLVGSLVSTIYYLITCYFFSDPKGHCCNTFIFLQHWAIELNCLKLNFPYHVYQSMSRVLCNTRTN